MRTIHVVAFECYSTGGVDWYLNEVDAAQAFQNLCSDLEDHTITAFNFEASDDMTNDEVTDEADNRMWEIDYECTDRRVGSQGYIPGATDPETPI